MLKISWIVVCSALLAATAAASPSIVLDPNSPGNGVFWYDLAVPDANGATFLQGDQITFSGMFGVTSATAVEEVQTGFGSGVYFTANEAIFTMNLASGDTYPNDQGAPYSYFEIDPPGSSVGSIQWSIQDAGGTFTGTVPGPVAPAPEPGSLIMMGSGILGLAGVIRRKLGRYLPMPSR